MPKIHETSDVLFDMPSYYIAPIGRYIMAFGAVEKAVDWAIVYLIEARHTVKAETAIAQLTSFTSKVQLLGALAGLTTRRKKHLNAIKRLQTTLYEINTYRNHIVHGAWDSFASRRRGRRAIGLTAEKNKIHPRKLAPFTFTATPAEISRQTLRIRYMPHKIITLTCATFADRDPTIAQKPKHLVIRLSPNPQKNPLRRRPSLPGSSSDAA